MMNPLMKSFATQQRLNVLLHYITVWLKNNLSVTKPLALRTEWGQGWLCANGGESIYKSIQLGSKHPTWQFWVADKVWRWLISSSFQQLQWEGEKGWRQKTGMKETARLLLRKEKKEINSMYEPLTTNWHSSSVVLCLHVCFTIRHCGFVWIHQNRQENWEWDEDRGGKKEHFLRETQASGFCRAFPFFHFPLCNIISPLCPAFITLYPKPHTHTRTHHIPLPLSEAELGVGSKRQETDKIKAVSWFFNSQLLCCQAWRQPVKKENILLDVSLHSCCR